MLFNKIEDAQIAAEIQKLGRSSESEKEYITYEDFQKMKLSVGKILAAEPVPKSKKALQATSRSLGSEMRQIVAGIKEHYSAEAADRPKVVVVANLKPATLMGIESQGML